MANGISTIGQSLANIRQIRTLQIQYAELTAQLNTGKKSQKFSGLGTNGVVVTQRARADVKALEVYQSNITNAKSRIDLMLNAVEEFQAQAEIFEDLLFGLSQESLHQKGEIVYGPATADSTADLVTGFPGPGALTALIAANAPDLDPPNDQFVIRLEDTIGSNPPITVTIDISDAEAAAGGGNAQTELINYINTQLAAAGANTAFNAIALPNGNGFTIRANANITINASETNGMGAAGLAALGLSETTYAITEDDQVGYTSGDIDSNLETLQRLSGKVYDFLVDLLNIQQGDRYLLGGADTSTQPINKNGSLATALSVQLNNWKTGVITTDDFIANLTDRNPLATSNPDAISDTIVGYSAALSAGTVGNVSVRVNERSEIDYTMLANAQGFRDILVAASVFANDNLYPLSDVYASPYTPGDPVLTDENGNPLNGVPGATLEEQKANFFQLLTSVREMVTKAQSSINELKFGLSTAQARISEIETGNRQEKAVLDTIVSENEDVDINTVAVRLNALQISLQASMTVTGNSYQLSLINYLSF